MVGIAAAAPSPESSYFTDWVHSGYAASMKYLTRRMEERLEMRRLIPGVRSVIVCGLLYNTRGEKSIDRCNRLQAWVSRYAWGYDYHRVVAGMLAHLLERLRRTCGVSFQSRVYVDTGPVLEKVYAYRAGLGWFGKNSCILNKRFGSYFFLGVILTDLKIEPGQPERDHCGDCTLCVDACPTGAIVVPRVVDSRRCISYQTIENREEVPEFIRPQMGGNVFGCDICQEVCPWNRKAPRTSNPVFQPRSHLFQPEIAEMIPWIRDEYPSGLRASPLKRAKRAGLLRNLMIATANSGAPELLPLLYSLRSQEEIPFRSTLEWAIAKLENREN